MLHLAADIGLGRPLLFLPSYLHDSRQWAEPMARLSDRARCLAIDWPGHGAERPPVQVPDLDTVVVRLARILRDLDCGPALLVGSSVGSMVALRLALSAPELVAGLVCCCPTAEVEPPPSRERFLAMLDAVEVAGRLPPEIIEAVVPGFFAPGQERSAAAQDMRHALESWPQGHLPALLAFGRAWITRDAILPELPRLADRPVDLLVGSADPYRPAAEARAVAAALPGAHLHEVTGSGHLVDRDAPELLLACIERQLLALAP